MSEKGEEQQITVYCCECGRKIGYQDSRDLKQPILCIQCHNKKINIYEVIK